MDTTDFDYIPHDWNSFLAGYLLSRSDVSILRHFLGIPIPGAPALLNEVAVVCIDTEWWQKEPKPTTEIGVAELITEDLVLTPHAENILIGMHVAHARIKPHAHLLNNFAGAGDPEKFHFGKTRFVSMKEAREVVENTFVRSRQSSEDAQLQPIILIGHAVDNEFDLIERAFSVDLRSFGTIIKVIDTQEMAREAGIEGPNGPNIGLRDLLAYFNVRVPNLHTAGNDAAGTMIAAVLLALRKIMYPSKNGPPATNLFGREIQDVINNVMTVGKSRPAPNWGQALFCTRCGRDNHVRDNCFAKVHCTICHNSGVVRLYNAARTHTADRCMYQYLDLPASDY
ncbi:hypothetical protein T440DRAFT_130838 [Plenodomus tracheiphilus IPT5]|uniref:Gfd2/YDR514C-like C-terminal domain-containing protein n=1 Tax=Plenodomus tracheiphilus IPT5 TaxID=1408161 RepID=A0A6A7B5I0_9PLEO|nr:hypothetical protein T440DRAFT_130838 [Plenodomus tracheiphilus IPT5]